MRHRLALFTLPLLAACATEPTGSSTPVPVNTSLSALMSDSGASPAPTPAPLPSSPSTIESLTHNQPDIQAILDRETPPPTPQPEVVAEAQPFQPEPAATIEPDPEPVVPQAPPKTLAERIDETSLLLTDLLRQNTATTDNPFQTALALAAMETVRPGSAPKVITPEQTDGLSLTEEQRHIVNAFRRLASGLNTAATSTSDDLTEQAVELGNDFLRARPMRITTDLAAQVTGFGQYTPLDGRKLQQGRPTKAIIYTEIRRFGQRPVVQSDNASSLQDKYAVELSQELQLIHDADGVKAWQRPEQTVIETSRNFRSDFYLVQNITLPHTLSIGAYKLKVIVRDRVTGDVDEAIIPLQVVADPALVRESGKGLYD